MRKNYYVRSRLSSDEEEKKEEGDALTRPERIPKGKRFSAVPQYEPECETCYLEYLVEFAKTDVCNMSTEALGGLHFESLFWILEVEPFSAFSYSVMRSNIYNLCADASK